MTPYLLEHPLILKYFRDKEDYKFAPYAPQIIAYRILQAMEEKIKKGDNYIYVFIEKGILKVHEMTAEYDYNSMDSVRLRLPSQFQTEREACCEYGKGNWGLKPAGSYLQVCADCMIKLTKPSPSTDGCHVFSHSVHCSGEPNHIGSDVKLPSPINDSVDAVEEKISEITTDTELTSPTTVISWNKKSLEIKLRQLVALARQSK